jgi:hypothetical protein
MYRHFRNTGYRNASAALEYDAVSIAQSGQLDARRAGEDWYAAQLLAQ